MKASFFGDSHINPVKLLDASMTEDDPRYKSRYHHFDLGEDHLRVAYYGSASAVGLTNPNSEITANAECEQGRG